MALKSPVSAHVERPTDRRIPAHTPDFRIEVIVNERDAPKDCDAQLNRYGKLCGHVAVRCFQADVSEDLAWTLIKQAEENSERDVVAQAAADEGGGAVFFLKIFLCN